MPVKFVYSEQDRERLCPENTKSVRDDFTRDRARVLHAAYMRRLADKTQVYSPLLHIATVGNTTVRNRLTHSVEVAQIGMDIAQLIGVNPNIVDTACLAHDIGHPPFGHNGERVLNQWAREIGGFEGNAQTFRVITRLEPKVYRLNTRRSFGLNLTRASLNAVCKYPWSLKDARRFCGLTKPASAEPEPKIVQDSSYASGHLTEELHSQRPSNSLCNCETLHKFGVYEMDMETFSWVRKFSKNYALSIEAQIMDFADDVAYSVHDFEDSLLLEKTIQPVLYAQELPKEILQFVRNSYSKNIADKAEEAFSNLREMWSVIQCDSGFIHSAKNSGAPDFSMRNFLAKLKNLTSSLIGHFAYSAIQATEELFATSSTLRQSEDTISSDLKKSSDLKEFSDTASIVTPQFNYTGQSSGTEQSSGILQSKSVHLPHSAYTQDACTQFNEMPINEMPINEMPINEMPINETPSLAVPNITRAEIAVLKSIVFVCVMEKRRKFYALQAEALLCLVEKMWQLAYKDSCVLDPLFHEDWEMAKGEEHKRRVLLDQIASLTDPEALSLMKKYCSDVDVIKEFFASSETVESRL